MLTGSDPAIDSSSPCSSFRSKALSGFSCAGLCFTSGSPPRFLVAGCAIMFSSPLCANNSEPGAHVPRREPARRAIRAIQRQAFGEPKPGRTTTMKRMACIEDLREQARRKVPKMFFDYADAGSYNQENLRANRTDFEKLKLRQRILVNMDKRTTATTILGEPVP